MEEEKRQIRPAALLGKRHGQGRQPDRQFLLRRQNQKRHGGKNRFRRNGNTRGSRNRFYVYEVFTKDKIKNEGTGRTATTELYKIIENSYPVGYEDVDLKHKENRQDLRGQFVYGSLTEIVDESGVGQKYIATIKFDDTRVDHRARFKDLAVKKIEDALSTGDPQKGLPTPSKQESSTSDITMQQIIDSVKQNFEKVSGFHPIADGNGANGTDTEARASFHDAMLQAVKQKFGSGNTSNRQVAAGFKKIDFAPGNRAAGDEWSANLKERRYARRRRARGRLRRRSRYSSGIVTISSVGKVE